MNVTTNAVLVAMHGHDISDQVDGRFYPETRVKTVLYGEQYDLLAIGSLVKNVGGQKWLPHKCIRGQ